MNIFCGKEPSKGGKAERGRESIGEFSNKTVDFIFIYLQFIFVMNFNCKSEMK